MGTPLALQDAQRDWLHPPPAHPCSPAAEPPFAAALRSALLAGDASAFLSVIGSALRSSSANFKQLQAAGAAVFAERPVAARRLALPLVEAALAAGALSHAHLVLDVLPPPAPGCAASDAAAQQRQQPDGCSGGGREAPAAAEAAAAATLFARVAPVQPRLAAKLAQAYSLSLRQLSGGQQAALLELASSLLDAASSTSVGVSLLLQFEELQARVAVGGRRWGAAGFCPLPLPGGAARRHAAALGAGWPRACARAGFQLLLPFPTHCPAPPLPVCTLSRIPPCPLSTPPHPPSPLCTVPRITLTCLLWLKTWWSAASTQWQRACWQRCRPRAAARCSWAMCRAA